MKEFEDFKQKHTKELQKMVDNKFVTYYVSTQYANLTMQNYMKHDGRYDAPITKEQRDYAITVVKITRPMLVDDLFNPFNIDQELKNKFDFEKELTELRTLKQSIDQIKKIIKD